MTTTALNGALLRDCDGFGGYWRWRDEAEPDPRITDMGISQVHNLRCITYGDGTYVEVPPRLVGAPENPELDWIGAGSYRTARDYRGRIIILVPVADWDARPPCGASWDRAHEPAILARAATLR